MASPESTAARYLGDEYFRHNPTWDVEDSPWKARKVLALLSDHQITPVSLVDVGCGAGVVLAELRGSYPAARLAGYDIAPDAERFWAGPRAQGIELVCDDFSRTSGGTFDVLMALDVLEHLQDPFAFLDRIRARARYFVFHVPLDLSAGSVLRETPLLGQRANVGHLHFYTRGLAEALLRGAGYRIVDSRYTGAALETRKRSLGAWLALLPRRLVFAVNRDLGARLLGGETLLVLATADAG